MDKLAVGYQVVFDKIMAELKKGVAPWKKSWTGRAPFNVKSGKNYRGINFWILLCSDFADPRWLSFKQAQAMGGQVRKGEKGTPVVFWTFFEDRLDPDKKVPFLRYYTVFNVEQIDGLDLPSLDSRETYTNVTAEEIVAGYVGKPTIKYGADLPCYIPARDLVKCPKQASFTSDDAFYSILFHELAHSTGHETRLSRKGVTSLTNFGDALYSEEELVAEMTASFLAAKCGIESTTAVSASYILGWSKYITDNPKVLVHAASKAQKAADYILGVSFEPEEEASAPIAQPIANNPQATIA